MTVKTAGQDEIRQGLWPESRATQSLRGQGNEEDPIAMEKGQLMEQKENQNIALSQKPCRDVRRERYGLTVSLLLRGQVAWGLRINSQIWKNKGHNDLDQNAFPMELKAW